MVSAIASGDQAASRRPGRCSIRMNEVFGTRFCRLVTTGVLTTGRRRGYLFASRACAVSLASALTMPFTVRRCALPLAAALVLLGSAACGDAAGTNSRLGDTSVDSSDTRAHRVAGLVTGVDTLSTLARALRRGGLLRELRRGGPYTLFAPTDDAFRRHWPGFDSLLAPAGTSGVAGGLAGASPGGTPPELSPRDTLRTLLRFHLVRGRFAARSLTDSLRLSTLADKSLMLERARRRGSGRRVRVREMPRPVPVRRTLRAQNGVIHVLPRPLRIPPPDTSAEGALGDTTAATPSPNAN